MKRDLALAAIALLTACSHSSQSSQSTSQVTPGPAGTNATGFPLYEGSTVIASRDWTQSVNNATAATQKGVFSQGAGTYAGRDVIAHTSATVSQLRGWLDAMAKSPPAGYTAASGGAGMQEARSRAQSFGLDFDVFQRDESGKRHHLVVIAIDPGVLQGKAGPMLGFVNKYRMLPQSLRDPLDAQAKQRTGFSISDALSPDTPIGASLGALDQLRQSGDRGIVIVDAAKQ
ncbi:MAG: hypothetical protein M3R51_01480 [Candidatus Eremiobacteraeota bacterium]|nr:hypothetical protein [Candidatus Eremiobacteraeota bacterium]